MIKCILCLQDKNDFNLSKTLQHTYHQSREAQPFTKHREKLNNLLGFVNMNLSYFVSREEVCSDCHNDIHYNYEMLEMKVKLIHS